MYDLTIIHHDGGAYIDSREVAGIIGKRHDHLLRDIRNYVAIIAKRGFPKIGVSDFFIESSYKNAQNKEMPRYLISKMGCEIISHKMTGEKGVLFTASYVAKFNALEAVVRNRLENEREQLEAERDELESELLALTAMPPPRLGEFNACARIVVRALRDLGATPEQLVKFLKGVYEPIGIAVADDDEFDGVPRLHTAKQIAKRFGVYSMNGRPHHQAVSCILNEILFMGDGNKNVTTDHYGSHVSVCVRYDDYAVKAVGRWLLEHGLPDEVHGFERTYRVLYK